MSVGEGSEGGSGEVEEGGGETEERGGRAGEDRSTCTPCRGTGRLQSALGGEVHEVTCPWCGGSGRFVAGRDAQSEAAETPDSAA